MIQKFRKAEKISLLLNFYTDTKGYWKKHLTNYPEAIKFINMGFATLNKRKDKFILNFEGRKVLYSYAKEITKNFIEFLEQNKEYCNWTDVEEWYIQTYRVQSAEEAERIREFIADNAYKYGFQVLSVHLHGHGNMCYTLNE